jgi:hypothetical protein
VETLVTGDELVGEGKTGHQTTLLQPEDGGKRAREEDTLDGSKGNKALSKGGLLVLNPLDGPLSLLVNAWDYLESAQQHSTRFWFDVLVSIASKR